MTPPAQSVQRGSPWARILGWAKQDTACPRRSSRCCRAPALPSPDPGYDQALSPAYQRVTEQRRGETGVGTAIPNRGEGDDVTVEGPSEAGVSRWGGRWGNGECKRPGGRSPPGSRRGGAGPGPGAAGAGAGPGRGRGRAGAGPRGRRGRSRGRGGAMAKGGGRGAGAAGRAGPGEQGCRGSWGPKGPLAVSPSRGWDLEGLSGAPAQPRVTWPSVYVSLKKARRQI